MIGTVAPALGAAAGAAVGWIEGRTLGARAALEAGRRARRARWIWEQQRRTAAAYEQARAEARQERERERQRERERERGRDEGFELEP